LTDFFHRYTFLVHVKPLRLFLEPPIREEIMIDVKILRRPELEKRVGLKRSAIYGLIKKGKFPRPIKLGPRSVGWVSSEINAWADGKVAERDAEAKNG
jgi:prophage regulatory protein